MISEPYTKEEVEALRRVFGEGGSYKTSDHFGRFIATIDQRDQEIVKLSKKNVDTLKTGS